jgi:hypothetical protein
MKIEKITGNKKQYLAMFEEGIQLIDMVYLKKDLNA